MTGIEILKERRNNLIEKLRATDDPKEQDAIKWQVDEIEEKMCEAVGHPQ